ncbi:NifU family protein [Candidatus Haliotispira prima]|uniref:NifU family protein n=1 Tax=Candidatus Haliotispira prima TaxID=3034016 RepID=A0ABY8MHP5_9SPIO|nr:NifU family protein [Candidatus Haliotispira prima]
MTFDEVNEVLQEIRPALQGDGGDIELVEIKEAGEVIVRMQGACHGCPMSMMTLKQGVERYLMSRIPDITEVNALGMEMPF